MVSVIENDTATVPAPITVLMAEYAHCIDDDRLEDWPEFFTDPCLYRITTRDNDARGLPASIIFCDSQGMLQDRVVSVRHANVFEPHRYRHMVSCTRVLGVDGGVHRLHSNYLVTRTMLDGTMAVFSTGVYRDLVELDGNRARFRERVVVCDHSMINNLIALPL